MTTNELDMKSLFAIVWDDLASLVKTQALRLAAQLRLADLVKDGPKSVAELAEATGTHKHSLYRLLKALASCEYFEEIEPQVFAQTSRSYLFRTDIPQSMHDFAIMHGEEWQWSPWLHALRSIQTGKAVFPEVFGKDLWHYFREDNPEAGKRFHQAMTSQSKQTDQAIASGYDFAPVATVCDVAGGEGGLLECILQRYPKVSGILFEQPSVIEVVQQRHVADEARERMTMVSGDFFAAVPSGADIYILKQVIHDWEDPESIQILKSCRKAMQVDGRLLIVDEIMASGKEIPVVALIDLQLLITLNGRKRSEDEYRELFEASELRLNQILPTASAYSILEVVVQ
jgi:hypothetical protein